MAKGTEAPPSTAPVYEAALKRETPVKAIAQILLAAGVAGGTLFWYSSHVSKQKAVAELRTKAEEAARADDAPALLKAKALYEQIPSHGVSIESDEKAVVQMAELTAQLYQGYGMAEMRGEAQRWVEVARQKNLEKAERYAAEAYLMIGDGDLTNAEAMLRDLTDKKGVRNGKILHALSVANLELGKFKEAQMAAETGMKLSVNLVRLPIAHGDALLAQGNYSSARTAYKRAIQLNGNHLSARTAILLAQAVSGDGGPALLHKEADKLREEAISQSGGTAPPRVLAFIEYADGEVYLRAGADKNALAKADSALAAYPKLHRAHTLRGRALARLGKAAEAKAAFEEAMKAAPTSLPYATLAAETLWRAGKVKESLPLLKGVTEASPKSGEAFVQLAVFQARAGLAKESDEAAKKATELLGNAHEKALFATARALQANGKLDESREKYNEALQAHVDQKWPEVFYEMGWVRFEEKNYEDAAMLFQEAVKVWEKGAGTLDEVADGLDAMGQAYGKMGGKKNDALSAEIRDKASKVRRGL
jgi:tetratricopeptide (TPR) repeat protein